MANTTVTDAYMFANVTQVNAMNNSKMVQAENMSFTKAMGDASGKNISNDADSQKTQPATGTQNLNSNRNSVKDQNTETDTTETADETEPGRMEAAAKETVKKADDIKEEIKDELDVTDEDIANAMETLGLSMQDVFNQDSLKDLMMELSGTEDSLELLTNEDLYEGMQNILNEASEIVTDITEEFGITEEDFTSLLDDDQLFGRILNEMEESGFSEMAFGPIEENAAFQAEVPEIAPDRNEMKDEASDGPKFNILVNQNVKPSNVSDNSQTETFRNISQTEKSELNNENSAAGMTRQVTVTVNELGDVVETVESFSRSFSDAENIMSQVTENIKLNVSQDTTSMEMQLHPASLGTVNMQVTSQNGVVTAHLLVQNEAVKTALESQLVQLQETFEEQGKTVDAVEVSVANYDLDRGMNQNAQDEQKEQALRAGRIARRRLRLDSLEDEDLEELGEDERIAADMMRRQGNSLDYMA